MKKNKLKVGDKVDYHAEIGGEITSRDHIIKCIGDIPSAKGVAWITGKAGCVSLKALSKSTVTEQERIFTAIKFHWDKSGYVDINLLMRMTGVPEIVLRNVLFHLKFKGVIKGQFTKKKEGLYETHNKRV